MKHDDIRKLLGGYATNTLSDEERKALFEAALEDQSIFDALQQEEALKELLRDQTARADIRAALATPAAEPWWLRRWVWAGALAAAALVILAVVTLRPFARSRPIEIASTNAPAPSVALEQPPAAQPSQPASNPVPNPLPARKLARDRGALVERASPATAGSLAAPSAPEPIAPAASAPVAAPSSPPVPAPAVPPAIAPRARIASQALGIGGANPSGLFAPNSAATANSRTATGLRYSLVERDAAGVDTPVSSADLKPGDVVRIRASAGTAGNLALFEQDAAGGLRQVFPGPAAQALVAANSSVTLDWPIVIQNERETFRLTWSPAESEDAKASASLKKLTPATQAIDIQIGPAH